MAYLDYAGLQRFWEQVKNRLDNKVDKSEGQSDWSVDDATSPSYVKNRTHYDTILSKTLFDGTITATAGTLTRINSIPDEMIVNYPDVSVVRATFDGKACTITATTNKWELRDPNGQLVFTMNYDTAKGAQCLVSTYAGSGAHTLVIEADEVTAVPLDEKYIPNTIPRRTDIPKMAMPDWNASEGEAGYVKNRTHYEEKNVIIPNTIIDVPSSDLFAALPVLDTAIVAGNSYVVELDNEKYTCVAWADGDVIYLGNGNVYPGVNKGENVPFSIDTYPDKTAFLNTQVGKEYVVSIATPGNVKQLDEKFIPDSVKMPKAEGANMQLITDGEGNAKWEERTHWMEKGKQIIEGNCIIETPLNSSIDFDLLFKIENNLLLLDIIVGKDYIVTWQGKDYICTCRIDWLGDGYNVLGNQGLFWQGQDDNDFPFIFIVDSTGIYIGSNEAGDFNFSISEANIHTVDKYVTTPNWNASKGEPGYIENRTHYLTYKNERGYYSTGGQSVDFGEDGIYTVQDTSLENIPTGSKIYVIWNNKTYICESVEYAEEGVKCNIFGNKVLLTEEIGEEPFFGMISPPSVTGADYYTLVMVSLQGSGENSFSINYQEAEYHTIDPKFLGNNLPRKEEFSIIWDVSKGEANEAWSFEGDFEKIWNLSNGELLSSFSYKIINYPITQYNQMDYSASSIIKYKTEDGNRALIVKIYIPAFDSIMEAGDTYILLLTEEPSIRILDKEQYLPPVWGDYFDQYTFLVGNTENTALGWRQYGATEVKEILNFTAEDIGAATTTYVDNKVAALVDSSPDTLNTLNELAAALGDDPNFATTIATQIGELEESKVEKITGKGLSTNDFTNAEKNRLAEIAANYVSTDDIADLNEKVTAAHSHATTYKGSAFANGLYKITTNAEGHITGATAVAKADITALGIPAQDTDTGATSVEVTGAGNAITAASYDATSRKLTLTKGATYTNNQGTITGVSAGTGLSGGGTSGAVAISHVEGSAVNKTSGLYKFSTDATSHVKSVTAVTKADIVALGIPETNTTYSAITNAEIDAICGQL